MIPIICRGPRERAAYRKKLKDGGYWSNLCREKNGKPVYRWRYVTPRGKKGSTC